MIWTKSIPNVHQQHEQQCRWLLLLGLSFDHQSGSTYNTGVTIPIIKYATAFPDSSGSSFI
eukprot:scaffold133178_cov67-Attheya_sp.AAC.2